MREQISVYAPGHMDPYDSYGLIGCELVRHLSSIGVFVNAVALGKSIHPNQDEDLQKLTSRPLRPDLGGILLGYPTVYKAYGPLAHRGPCIAMTMFESTKIPEEWPNLLNMTSAVVVPSEFCRESFADCGVTVPIHVIPLGVRPIYKPKERSHDGPFRFLTFLDRGQRKGGFIALQAFVKEFFDDENVELVLKMRRVDSGPALEILNPNITVIQKDLTEEELYELYLSCHCFVNPNKGEGFGLIPREFAATGGISLTTNWGGTSEALDLWGWPLPYEVSVADWKGHRALEGKDLGNWANPHPDEISKVMRYVVDNREEYQKRAMIISSQVPEMYSWGKFAEEIYGVWKDILNGNGRSDIMAS